MTKLLAALAFAAALAIGSVTYIFGRSKAGKSSDRARVTRFFNKSKYNVKSTANSIVKYFNELFSARQKQQAAA